jgi:hypothetical protein
VTCGGSTRIYVSTRTLCPDIGTAESVGFYDSFLRDRVLGPLTLNYDDPLRPKFRPSTPIVSLDCDISTSRKLDLAIDQEICIIPETEGDVGQLQLARQVKDALDDFEKFSLKRSEGRSKGYLGKFTILVGDEVPACPCCGLRK